MAAHTLSSGGLRPYFAEVPYYLWGQVNYESDGDCRRPRDREWTSLYLANRDTDERVEIALQDSGWRVEGSEPAAARVALFLSHRCGAVAGEPLDCGAWDHARGAERAAAVALEFDRPELDLFDSELFWGSWKWIGWYASEARWAGRWIMHSVVRHDPRAVKACVELLRHDPSSNEQSSALRGALELLTQERFGSPSEWIRWYDEVGARQWPEPDLDAWLADLKSQTPSR
jgi:hypothetical protein